MRTALRVLLSLVCGVMLFLAVLFVGTLVLPGIAPYLALGGFLVGLWLPWRHPHPKAMSHTAQQSQEQ